MSISRRAFVRAGGLAAFSLGLDPLFLGRAAYALDARRVTAAAGRTLVCLFQRGAVDGLSMVAPHGDPWYYSERPRIAIPKSDLLDLDGHFGLHPGLTALKPLWDNHSLALVQAVGSPDTTRSHFDAQGGDLPAHPIAGLGYNHIGAVVYDDVQVGWKAPWKAHLSLGARNIFGKEPPLVASSFAQGFDASYDLPGGPFYYFQYRQDF